MTNRDISTRQAEDGMQRGDRIRDHVLLEKIGDGGMGEVWTAEHTQIKRVDAIKFLRDFAGLQPEAKDRFLNEARVQGQMHHPNIVGVFGAFEEQGSSYIVMQYVEGGSLEQRLHRSPGQLMPLADVVRISTDVLAALAYSHTFLPIGHSPDQPGVVHRDVKPSNILLDRSGRALLTDFGIAFATGGNRMTKVGMTLGTVFYMSPEQIQDPSKVDLRSDIYSFGCVLYELLSGRPPFGAETDTEFTIKTKHIRDTPTPIRTWNQRVPFDFEWIVYKALNKDPGMRFANCVEMSQALTNAFSKYTNAPAGGQGPVTKTSTGPQAVEPPTPVYGSPATARTATVIQPVPHPSGGTPVYSATSVPVVTPVVVPVSAQPPRKRGPLLWVGVAVLLLLLGVGAYFLWPTLFGTSGEEVILTLKGSTSVGDELAPKMAEAFFQDKLKATKTGQYIFKKDEKGVPYVHVWGDVPGKGRQAIEIYATKSGDGFKCLVAATPEKHCDIGMSSRPFGADDQKDSPSLPDVSGKGNEHVIALDGIAVVVNPSNPISQLTIAQLRGLYTGQYTNWNQVGGNDAPVELYGREKGSGTRTMFEEIVLGKDKQKKPIPDMMPEDHAKGNGSDVVDVVLSSPNAIGYVSSPLVKGAKALAVSDGGESALRPSEMAVVSEDYAINRRLFLYTLDGSTQTAKVFIDFAVSGKGQEAVTSANYAGLTPHAFDVIDVPAGAPALYQKLAREDQKLGLSFRFASGNASSGSDSDNKLDNLASDNLHRLEIYLNKYPGTISKIYVVGYADNVGGAEPNKILALKRAQSIAKELAGDRWYVPTDNVLSLGLLMPVATNGTEEGKRKNRRVEVWVPKGTE